MTIETEHNNNLKNFYMGIDIGSVSLDIAIVDNELTLVKGIYRRTEGEPLRVLIEVLSNIAVEFSYMGGVICTGSGRRLIADILEIGKEHEIITHAKGTVFFHPEVKTIIEIGGQDSKLIFLEYDERIGKTVIIDHALNELCAAGTGAFLDQQANRLELPIEEFSNLAIMSKKPANIAGRCSVFAKSDMMHLQQEGVPKSDIVSGLCYALTRNYISNLGKGKRFERPIAFQGGVAANKGVSQAFQNLLGLNPGELIIPNLFNIMGAYGAAMIAQEKENAFPMEITQAIDKLKYYMQCKVKEIKKGRLVRLVYKDNCLLKKQQAVIMKEKRDVYLGIDIGSVSTKMVILDKDKNLLAKHYLLNNGEPIHSLKRCFSKLDRDVINLCKVRGLGVTGSGRYFVGDFIGADLVANEITAHARGALEIDETVDTVIEIGGQDSKYIRIKNGVVVSFKMNKVCAAGTGSFIHEQAKRLGVEIEDEFARLSFLSKTPVDLGTRCTVFMESDLIHHQQLGSDKNDLVAGLAYSVSNNYIEKVVGNEPIGEHVFFQGGVANNKGVVSAMENILGKPITVPPNNEVVGAIGAAIMVMDKYENLSIPTCFVGFDIGERSYNIKTFECPHCSNRCEIKHVNINNEKTLYYGGICDRYEESSKEVISSLPDLFSEREKKLISYIQNQSVNDEAISIGLPRALIFMEQLPFWTVFFNRLGFKVVISGKSNKQLIDKGLKKVLSEVCYPVKLAYSYVNELIEKGVHYIFFPSIIDLKITKDVNKSYNCPLIQSIPFQLLSAFEDQVKIIYPTLYMSDKKIIKKQLFELGRSLDKSKKEVAEATAFASKAWEDFIRWRQWRGREILSNLNDKTAVVIIGKPYNVHDPALNLRLAQKLRRLGVQAIPIDFLPLHEVNIPPQYSNLVWFNDQNQLRGAIYVRENVYLNMIKITNFACGPDAFIDKYFEDIMEDKPYLVLEVDEHSSDGAMITRIEAFLDTFNNFKGSHRKIRQKELPIVRSSRRIPTLLPSKLIKQMNRIIYISDFSGHSHVLAATFRLQGIESRVLPPPDEESDALGRKYVADNVCYPYLLMVGDMVKMTRYPDFNPDRAAYYSINSDCSCRVSQYPQSLKMVLERLGLKNVPIIAPCFSINHEEYTPLFGFKFSSATWKGYMAVDVLQKKLLHTRPYEVISGESDRVYEKAIKEISVAIANENNTNMSFFKAFSSATDAIDKIIVRREDRPIIGIVGEFLSYLSPFINNNFIRDLESMGVEVRLGSSNADYGNYYIEARPRIHFSVRAYIIRWWSKIWKYFIETKLDPGLEIMYPIDQYIALAAPYVSDAIDPMITMNIAKAEDYVRRKCSGIANLIPLNCIYGNVGAAILKRVQRKHNCIPLLNIMYDGLKKTNEQTRIEAFVNQIKVFHERYINN